jgi:acyl-CoA thioester hydrolase
MTEAAIFRRTRGVIAADVDQLGHVNNAVWVRFVVELADAHSRALGLDWAAYRRIGGMWIVRRHEIDYLAPAVVDEELVESTYVSEMRGARSVRHAQFHRASDGLLLVSALTQWAWVDTRTQRPKRIAPEVLERFPGAARRTADA